MFFYAGKCEALYAQWDTLCGDLKKIVLSKLSLHELACAAATSQDFRQAHLDRAAEERPNIIAAAEEGYGKRMFSTFVTTLQRPICGLRPHRLREDEGTSVSLKQQGPGS
jgi:hypothetical protein